MYDARWWMGWNGEDCFSGSSSLLGARCHIMVSIESSLVWWWSLVSVPSWWLGMLCVKGDRGGGVQVGVLGGNIGSAIAIYTNIRIWDTQTGATISCAARYIGVMVVFVDGDLMYSTAVCHGYPPSIMIDVFMFRFQFDQDRIYYSIYSICRWMIDKLVVLNLNKISGVPIWQN